MSDRREEIAVPDLLAYLLESPDTPTHVGVIQVFKPPGRTRAQTLTRRIVKAFRDSEVGAPFDRVPEFPRFGRPVWVPLQSYQPEYHVRQVSVPTPGDNQALLDMVADLHTGMMDRDYPGFMVYVIDGLEANQFALFWKIHHAYIDGAGLVLRLQEMIPDSADDDSPPRPLWAPLPDVRRGETVQASTTGLRGKLVQGAQISRELYRLTGQSLLRASGLREGEAPLPFSAPNSFFNDPLQAGRRLGAGSLDLAEVKAVAAAADVTVNEIALTLAGAALQQYSKERGEPLEKPLVAGCPMSVRREGDTTGGNQIVALTVKLGDPGIGIEERLRQVSASSRDAKAEARSVSREALMGFQVALGGLSSLASKTRWSEKVPPLTNVNLSNVPGPKRSFYVAGAHGADVSCVGARRKCA